MNFSDDTERDSKFGFWQENASDFLAKTRDSVRDKAREQGEKPEHKPTLPNPDLKPRAVKSVFSLGPRHHTKSGHTVFPKTKPSEASLFFNSSDSLSDFHDPYSDLNLFLSQKIQEELKEQGMTKKWSLYLQEKLIEKITPEFQRKFPKARLRVASLKKLWEKIVYFSTQLQDQKEALTKEGKLNVHFLIKENLKQYFQQTSATDAASPHFAHHLALKISEYVATIDGIRPMLGQLTKMIWASQHHLQKASALPNARSPYEEFDKFDRLIVKSMLEITSKYTHISQKDLESQVKEQIRALQELPISASLDLITSHVAALIADKLYLSSPFHTLYNSDEKAAVLSFIKRHISLYKLSAFTPKHSDVVRRTQALYTLACQIPKGLSEEEVELGLKTLHEINRPLPQELYAFIAAECHLMRGKEMMLYALYQEAQHLPELSSEMLEMIIWKILSEQESLLETLSYRSGQKILEEISSVLIDNPQHSFNSIVHFTVQLFRKTKDLVLSKKWSEIEHKITYWTTQGDLLCRWMRLDTDSLLLKLITELWKGALPHLTFIGHVTQKYLELYPTMAPYAPQIASRVKILYKYAWYALFGQAEETSFERFIQWHLLNFPDMTDSSLLTKLEEICKESLPLMPFDRSFVERLLAEQKIEPETQKWHA